MRLLAALCALSLFAPLGTSCTRQEQTQGSLLIYEYYYNGSMGRSGLYYKVERGENGVQITFSDKGVWDDEKKVCQGPDDALEVIGKMAADGALRKMKKHYKPVLDVLDGWSWNVHLKYESGSISSSGYMVKPHQAQWDAIEGINAYIQSLLVEDNSL